MKVLSSLGLKIEKNHLMVLDQTLLPHQEVWIESKSPEDMVALIKRLAIRGAPLIGVAAALALGKYAEELQNVGFGEKIYHAADLLNRSRPTAINLGAAIQRTVYQFPRQAIRTQDIIREAEGVFDDDVALCDSIARAGEPLIHDGDSILTHCNTGGLATAGCGTALGIVRRAHENGKRVHVYVDETRPLLQGARLTAWELKHLGIPFTLITDSMAGFLMKQGKVSKVIVGADRIAKNGDAANKIGTYSLAVLARYHQIPFFIAAPKTTVDENCPSGDGIPIEQRDANEVRSTWSPTDCAVYNPAFDTIPAQLISALILDSGVRELRD